jgi:hypothetical protein
MHLPRRADELDDSDGAKAVYSLTNAYSKKLEYQLYAVALRFMWVNFGPSMALSKGRKKVTLAMVAGLTDRVWTAEDILKLLDGE